MTASAPPAPPSSAAVPSRPPRGAPLSPRFASNAPLPQQTSPGVNDAEARLRALIAEQSRRSPLDELVRRSIVEGRQTPGKGSSAMVDGLEQLLKETGDLPWDEQRATVENLNDDDDGTSNGRYGQSYNGVGLAAPVSPSRLRPATVLPTRPLPPCPSPERSPSSISARHLHLPAPPPLTPASANASDDDAPPLPPSLDPQQDDGLVGSPAGGTADDVNDLYSRPTRRRTRLSTLGPKIRRDGPAPWEVEDAFEREIAAGADGETTMKTLRFSRSSPDFKDDADGAVVDETSKGKRAWIGSLGRKKKDRDDDASAAWKALGYAPPSPSAPAFTRRPSDSPMPASPSSSRFLAEPPSPGGVGSPHIDRNLKTRRSASGGLRKIFAKSPNSQAAVDSPGSAQAIHEISAPQPAPPPPNAVPIPQALVQMFEENVRPQSIALSTSPPAPPSPVARRRPPRLRASPQNASDPGFNLELRPVSMAFSAKFSDHLQSPTAPTGPHGESLSPRSAHGFGGSLASPRAESFASGLDEHGSSTSSPSLRSIALGRRPSEAASKKDAIAEEEDDDDDDDTRKDELILALRQELAAERDLRRRVVEDYENRMRYYKQLLIVNGMLPVHPQLPPTPRTPDDFVSPSFSPSAL